MIPLTDCNEYAELHDEPSRQLRIFPSKGEGESTFTLYEDDGISRRHEFGEFAEVTFELRSSARVVELRARRNGNFPLPSAIRVVPPADERRRFVLRGTDVTLVRER
jgi:alpha-glucosidase